MDLKPITIEDKEQVNGFLEKYSPQISELTFTNLFAWRLSKGTRFTIKDNHLLISFKEQEKTIFFQPIGKEPEKIINQVIDEQPDTIFERVEKSIAEKTGLNIQPQEDMFDYVYNLESLSELKGAKYEAKRNLISQCERYEPKTCILDEDTVNSFLKMQKKWCDEKQCEGNQGTKDENVAVKEALTNWKNLNLTGICVYIDKEIESFAIGERLNNTTFVEHFEKANTKFKGIYQYTLREFAKAIPKNIQFLNREQDLGIEGLKKAKKSYHPVKMIEKFRISSK